MGWPYSTAQQLLGQRIHEIWPGELGHCPQHCLITQVLWTVGVSELLPWVPIFSEDCFGSNLWGLFFDYFGGIDLGSFWEHFGIMWG